MSTEPATQRRQKLKGDGFERTLMIEVNFMKHWLIILSGVLLLVGCGQTGALYLPQDKSASIKSDTAEIGL